MLKVYRVYLNQDIVPKMSVAAENILKASELVEEKNPRMLRDITKIEFLCNLDSLG